MKIRMLKEPLSNNLVLKRRIGEFIFSVLRWALIIGLLYLFLFPILYMLLTAFQSADSAESGKESNLKRAGGGFCSPACDHKR